MALKERVITGKVRSDRKSKTEIKSHLSIKTALSNWTVSLHKHLSLKGNDSLAKPKKYNVLQLSTVAYRWPQAFFSSHRRWTMAVAAGACAVWPVVQIPVMAEWSGKSSHLDFINWCQWERIVMSWATLKPLVESRIRNEPFSFSFFW